MNAFGTEVSAGALTAGPSGEPGSGGVNDASWEDEIGNAEDDVEEALESLSAILILRMLQVWWKRRRAFSRKWSRRRKLRKRL